MKKKMKLSFSNRMFYLFNSVVWIVVMLIVLYPLYLVVIASVSDPDAIIRGEVIWHPVDFSLIGYKAVLGYSELIRSYGNSLFYTATGITLVLLLPCWRHMRCQGRSSRGRPRSIYTL